MNYFAEDLDGLLQSNALERIGIGMRRVCFRLPDGKYCLKCYRSDAEIEEGKFPGLLPFIPLSVSNIREIHAGRFDKKRNTCCQEYRYYFSLKKRLPADLVGVFPDMVKQVCLHDRGQAVVEELIVNSDGMPSKRFEAELCAADKPMREKLILSYRKLADDFVKYAVRFYDPPNILVQWLADGKYRLRVPDFEPVSRYFLSIYNIPFFSRIKARRRFDRYLRNIGFKNA